MDTAFTLAELTPEQRLALSYAGDGTARDRLARLFALDRRLAQAVARGGREPIAAQLRLAWWREQLETATRAAPEKLIAALREDGGGDAAPLIAMIDGWEQLLAEPPDVAACALGRAAPFSALAAALGCDAGQQDAARCAAMRWALLDLAGNLSEPSLGAAARELASASEPVTALPRSLRSLVVLDGLARRALRLGGPLLGDRLAPLAAIRLGIFGR